MPFGKRDLFDGEVIAIDVRPHWWFFAKPLFAGIPVLAVLIATHQQDGDVYAAGMWLTLVLAVVWGAWLGVKLLQWQTTRYIVTNQRLVFREGVLRRRSRDIPLDKVDDVQASRTILERIFKTGDIQIDTDEGKLQTTVTDIPHPEAFRQEILRQRVAGRAPAGTTHSIPDQIAALADLLDRGAISTQEYEAKKAQLLERM